MWDGSDAEREQVREVLYEVAARSRGRKMYTYTDYLLHAHQHYDKLDVHCAGNIGPSVDADGTMRLCGYNTGKPLGVGALNIRDLNREANMASFSRLWDQEMNDCSGCLWACFQLPPGAWDQPGIHKPQVAAVGDLIQIKRKR